MFQLSHQTIQNMKVIFHVAVIAVISFDLLRRAFFSLPGDWLFFLTSGAVENFTCALIAYALYYFVFKFTSYWEKIKFAICFISILVGLASLKDYRIHGVITLEQTFEYFTSFLGKSLVLYLLVFIINRFELFRRYNKLEKELNQAKEQLLRNQLHPHFLFNAFNTLYSLSLKNHPDTPDYILKLSGMMRYLTDETYLDKVPLSNEIDFIEKFIAIERIRFGDDARIQFCIDDADNGELIEPFLMIILVENAFKHGFYTNIKDAFVKIDLKVKDKELLCTVENSLVNKQHFQESNREGKGLENLKRRLELLYPTSSSLKISQTEYTYTTRLKISLDQ